MTISRVLIANRGEIAVRIIRACQALEIETVLAVSDADRDSLPASQADRAFCIGPAAANESYLNYRAIVMAAQGTGCDAIHPGYGFLAESPELADACTEHGLIFVGPSADHMRSMGNKIEARARAEKAGVPTLPGSEKVHSVTEAAAVVAEIGLPVMLKAAAGGGGKGMKIVTDAKDLEEIFVSAAAEARASFGDDTLYLERLITNARHIEVQVLGDQFGNVIHLGERDCSSQRRHQKLVEEAPAPGISDQFRAEIHQAAVILAGNINYLNAGTVEFLVDMDEEKFYFLEMNTRIQVEHPVTEMITGVDLVQAQFQIAAGEALGLSQSDVAFQGHAIECRINAEEPAENFRPTPGRITKWEPPEGQGIRLDSHCFEGYLVPIFYDSMLAKLIVVGEDRNQVLGLMERALADFSIAGISTTVPFLKTIINHPDFVAGKINTNFVERLFTLA